MSKALFKTDLAQEFWLKNKSMVSEYYVAIGNYDFVCAMQKAKILGNRGKDYTDSTENSLEDIFYNDMFICGHFSGFLADYADYWNKIMQKEYEESWGLLQNAIDSLRTINKFSFINKTKVFSFLEKQLQALEILYPYRLFSSIEAVVEKIECSICKKNMYSLECNHIKGELYRGQVAFGIINEIKDILSVSLVENPANKRCVMKAIDDKPIQFPCVEYLAQLVNSRKINPFMISHTVKSTLKEPVFMEKISRNSPCPCGSGKKYKKCCLEKTIDKQHIEIIHLNGHNGFSVEELTEMDLIDA